MIIYNPNDHGIEIRIKLPDNSGITWEELAQMINESTCAYTLENSIPLDDDRIHNRAEMSVRFQ